jgi:hypothetical protein
MSVRVTVNLTEPAARSLADAAALSGHTKTGVINAALRLYEHVLRLQELGSTLYVRGAASEATPERLRVL